VVRNAAPPPATGCIPSLSGQFKLEEKRAFFLKIMSGVVSKEEEEKIDNILSMQRKRVHCIDDDGEQFVCLERKTVYIFSTIGRGISNNHNNNNNDNIDIKRFKVIDGIASSKCTLYFHEYFLYCICIHPFY